MRRQTRTVRVSRRRLMRETRGRWSALGDGADELGELAQVATLEDAVAVLAVLGHDRVAGVPVAARLGVEPVDVPTALAHLVDDPGLRRVVVVARVAQEDDRRLRRDLVEV